MPLDGLLLIDKPAGMTSHDVVARVRKILGQRRVGHGGTLDPGATGLLPLVLGRATRVVRFLALEPKRYTGELVLGIRTTTEDLDGEVLARHAGPLPEDAAVECAAGRLVGRIRQVPPAISAKKIGGRRAYTLARRGVDVRPHAVEVEVLRFSVARGPEPDRARFEALVGAGTYVRGLVRDLGDALGCGAAIAALRRESLGPLSVREAVVLPHPDDPDAHSRLRSGVIPLSNAPLWPPGIRLPDAGSRRRFETGREQEWPTSADTPAGPVRVDGSDGVLLGIGELADGVLQPRVVLATVTSGSLPESASL